MLTWDIYRILCFFFLHPKYCLARCVQTAVHSPRHNEWALTASQTWENSGNQLFSRHKIEIKQLKNCPSFLSDNNFLFKASITQILNLPFFLPSNQNFIICQHAFNLEQWTCMYNLSTSLANIQSSLCDRIYTYISVIIFTSTSELTKKCQLTF